MDHGRLTDSNGKSVDFRNVILIMTTNAGAVKMAKQQIGFGRGQKLEAGTEAIEKPTPEFRNRLDAVIPFAPLETMLYVRLLINLLCNLKPSSVTGRLISSSTTLHGIGWPHGL